MSYNFLNEPYSGHFCCVYLICLDLLYMYLCRPMYIYMYIGKNAQNNSDNLLQAVGGSKPA